MKIANSVIDLIGHTPLMALNQIKQAHQLQANLIAKIESINPPAIRVLVLLRLRQPGDIVPF